MESFEIGYNKTFIRLDFHRPDVAILIEAMLYGPEYPLPDLLDHLAMPGCPKLNNQSDRCGVHYVTPIGKRD